MDRPRRCLYVPTESGHCTNCAGLPDGEGCPATGEPLRYGTTAGAVENLRRAARAFGAATVAALGLAAALKFVSDLLEGTADDDRA